MTNEKDQVARSRGDNIGRYKNRQLTHGAVHAQSKPILPSHGGVSCGIFDTNEVYPFFTESASSTSHVRDRYFDPALLIQLQRVAPDVWSHLM